MTVHINIHGATSIRATTSGTSANPLTISVKSAEHMLPHEVTIFANDPVLTERLVEAINRIDQERFEERHVTEARIANEGAAYNALDRSVRTDDGVIFEDEERGS